jgi:hypothetical protein
VEVIVPLTRSCPIAVAAWAAVVLALLGSRAVLLATPISVAEVAGWLVLAAAPPAILRVVFRGASSSIAQVLYDTEHSAETDGQRPSGRPAGLPR